MTMIEKIQAELNKIRPYLQADGGDVELIDVNNDIVRVRLTGTCGDCPFSLWTLKNRIEKQLMATIPEIKAVEAI